MYPPKMLMATSRKHLQQKVKEYYKVVYTTLSLFFFLANYHICNYFYPLDTAEHVRNWWLLKVDIYVLVICLCYFSIISKPSNNKRVKFIEDFMIYFGLGFAASNVIDRWIFDNRLFSWNGYFPLLLIAFVSYYNVRRLNKQAKKHLT